MHETTIDNLKKGTTDKLNSSNMVNNSMLSSKLNKSLSLCYSLPEIKLPSRYMQNINFNKMSCRAPVNKGQDVNEQRFVQQNLFPHVWTKNMVKPRNINIEKMPIRGDAWIKPMENPDYPLIDTNVYKFPKSKITVIKPLPRNRSEALLKKL
jgi:hypothetical protein